MLKILFQGDSLTDCGRDKTGHNPVQAYGYGYVNLIASKLLCDYPDTVVWNKAYNGSRIADTYSRWIEDALNIDCNILSILSGVNDIGFAIRMNQGADAKKFKFIYELMINEALEKNKDLKLVLGEPFLFKITNNTPELGRDIVRDWDVWERTTHGASSDSKELALIKYNAVFVPYLAFQKAIKNCLQNIGPVDCIHMRQMRDMKPALVHEAKDA